MANEYNNFGIANTPIGFTNVSYNSFGVVNSNLTGLSTITNIVTESVAPQALNSGVLNGDLNSANFVHNTSGWKISANGDAEFQSLVGVNLSGSTITGATISGGTITGTTVVGGTFKTSSGLPGSGSGIVIDGGSGTLSAYISGNLQFQIGSGTISFLTPLGVSSAQFLPFSANHFELDLASGMDYSFDTSYFSPTVLGGNPAPDLGQNSATITWNNVYGIHAYSTTSDRNAKENIRPLVSGIQEICKLNPVSYKLKTDPEENIDLGLIAQDVEESELSDDIKKSLINIGKDGSYTLKYSSIIPLLINAVRELSVKVDKLREICYNIKQNG